MPQAGNKNEEFLFGMIAQLQTQVSQLNANLMTVVNGLASGNNANILKLV